MWILTFLKSLMSIKNLAGLAVPALLSSHPLVKKLLPYIIGGIICVGVATWFYGQGEKACMLEMAQAQAKVDRKTEREREKARKEILQYKNDMREHQNRINEEIARGLTTEIRDCAAAGELMQLLNNIAKEANRMPAD